MTIAGDVPCVIEVDEGVRINIAGGFAASDILIGGEAGVIIEANSAMLNDGAAQLLKCFGTGGGIERIDSNEAHTGLQVINFITQTLAKNRTNLTGGGTSCRLILSIEGLL